jgi:hypothetical protein
MHYRIRDQHAFECDSCADVFEADDLDFSTAVRSLKYADWTIKKVGDVWIHNCPNCH